MDSLYINGLMVYKWTHGTENTHGIVSDSWYSISTPESHTYEREEYGPYAKLSLSCSLLTIYLYSWSWFSGSQHSATLLQLAAIWGVIASPSRGLVMEGQDLYSMYCTVKEGQALYSMYCTVIEGQARVTKCGGTRGQTYPQHVP